MPLLPNFLRTRKRNISSLFLQKFFLVAFADFLENHLEQVSKLKPEKRPISSRIRADPSKDVPEGAAVTFGNRLYQDAVVIVIVIPVHSLSIAK